ncbi:ARM repeat-containing protein [Pseudovirgaria hyperparasitica]|uniref:ARM repeat-containing protein n=1 Tax=Pseudovirgaria hyperparasitica TaxID=470096 RepID=A0A6A6WIV8_9PEZI|nr:ARM repeat-containing protein [Pseudovirgaria hyperparasitica]KAF2761637.1 ARM repeat-containing protein [Pseudovirgaria hyperparasitica]
MAGIKRKQVSDTPTVIPNEGKVKKVKKSTPSVPTASGVPAKSKPSTGKNTNSTSKKRTAETKAPAPASESDSDVDELEESDTSEQENGFYGFSAAGQGAAEEDSSEDDEADGDGDIEMSEPKPKSKTGETSEKAREKKSDNALNPTSSREAHAKQKAEKKERKAAKPNADSIARAKKLWERLRIKSAVEPEERKKLVEELFDIVSGRVKEFVFKHDAVRPVQCALKYASAEQRLMITKELKGDFRHLAESRYAKFLIAKLLSDGDDTIRDLIITDFYGHVRRLINHPEASWILDDAYRGAATRKQKDVLLREWYGPDFALFKSANKDDLTSNLSKILESAPEKRKPIMDYLQKLINQLIQKKLVGFTMLHDAMLQYHLNLKPESEEATEFYELIKGDEGGDLIKNLSFTKSGSRLVCHLLAYSDAKGRRNLLKLFKDTVEALAYDKHGHHVLLTAYEVIDDTKTLSKAIFPELFGDGTNESAQQDKIVALVHDLTGRKSVLSLLSNHAKWLYVQDDKDMLAEVQEIRSKTSKKDPEIRRKELVGYLSPAVINTLQHRAVDLSATSYGFQFITEALMAIPSPAAEALAGIAALAEGDPKAENHISQSAAGGRMLKTLVGDGRFNPETKALVPLESPLGFADLLYARIKDHIVDWATGPGSWVVVAMLENANFSHKSELEKTLRKNKKHLDTAASSETAEQKARREEKEKIAQGDKGAAKGQKKKKLVQAEVKVGNAGSKALLEKM